MIDIRIITNGLLLSKYSENILNSKTTNLFVSIDAATSDTYNRIRGRGFEEVRQAVKAFILKRKSLKRVFPFVRVSFVDMKVNTHEKEDFINYWSSIADFVDVQPGEDLSLKPSHGNAKANRFTCIAPWQKMSILSNGDVIPCCNFYGKYLPIGNIADNRIHDIWKSNHINQVRSDLVANTSPICSTCQSCTLLT